MDLSIEIVKKEEKEILRNLFEKYRYEFSQYDNLDVNYLGLYGYDYFDCYWTDENRYPYFIKVDNKLAGFAMVCDYQDYKVNTKYTMGEYFIMYKYRRYGIGKKAAFYIFDRLKGKWQLKIHPKNNVSELFWIKIIDEYTKGKYEIIKNAEGTGYDNEENGHIILFET